MKIGIIVGLILLLTLLIFLIKRKLDQDKKEKEFEAEKARKAASAASGTPPAATAATPTPPKAAPTPPAKAEGATFWSTVIVTVAIGLAVWYFWPAAKAKSVKVLSNAKQDPREYLTEKLVKEITIGAGEHTLTPGITYRLPLPTDRKVSWTETDTEAVLVFDPSSNRWMSQTEPLKLRYDPARRWIAFKSDRPEVKLTVTFR